MQSGAAALSQQSARELSTPQRLALICRSLLAYSPWFSIDGAIPRGLFRTPPGEEAEAQGGGIEG